jgi:hypothetical protein
MLTLRTVVVDEDMHIKFEEETPKWKTWQRDESFANLQVIVKNILLKLFYKYYIYSTKKLKKNY